jgi:hypothetical protein
LFAPTPPVFGSFDIADRFAVAAFVAGLHGQADVARFYADKLAGQGARAGVADAVAAEVKLGKAQGTVRQLSRPGRLSAEDTPGPSYSVSEAHREAWARPALGSLGARAPAGLSPARREPGGAAGLARRRLDQHRGRDPVAARRLSCVPDPRRHRPEGIWLKALQTVPQPTSTDAR